MAKAKYFQNVDPKTLDFDALDEQPEGHVVGHPDHWPVWVQEGLAFAKKVLAAVGYDLRTENILDPIDYLDGAITLLKNAPGNSIYKLVALGALMWLRKYAEPTQVVEAMKGAA